MFLPYNLLTSFGVGAGIMYILDPRQGHRRRALARDKMLHYYREAGRAANVTAKDLAHRAKGLVAETRGRIVDRAGVPDDILIARVRSELGRVASHVHAIEVGADNGMVILRGPVLADEVESIFYRVSRVRGVQSVRNDLDVFQSRDRMPSLQGEGSLGERNWAQSFNTPTARLFLSLGVLVAGVFAWNRRDLIEDRWSLERERRAA